MKGIIFNLVEDVVTRDHGVDAWEDLLDEAHVQGAYSAVGSYMDDELDRLVLAGAAKLGVTPAELLRHIGRRSIPLLKDRYPEFFDIHTNSRSFLGSLNEVIHPEVRKLYTGVTPPHFGFSDDADGSLLMEYYSHRSMCALAEGLILGAGDAFSQTLTVSQDQCKLDGYDHCTLRVAGT